MYVVSYDISSDKTRNKVSKKLLDYGKRVQYSVFECDIDTRMYKKMYTELVKITEDMEDGSIRFYFIDKNCQSKIVTIGNCEKYESMEEDIIFL